MVTAWASIKVFSLHADYPPHFMLNKFYFARLKSVWEKWGWKQIARHAHCDEPMTLTTGLVPRPSCPSVCRLHYYCRQHMLGWEDLSMRLPYYCTIWLINGIVVSTIVCLNCLCSWSISFDLSTHSVMACKNLGNAIVYFNCLCSWSISFDLSTHSVMAWKNLGNAIVCFNCLCSWSISFDLSTHSVMACKNLGNECHQAVVRGHE